MEPQGWPGRGAFQSTSAGLAFTEGAWNPTWKGQYGLTCCAGAHGRARGARVCQAEALRGRRTSTLLGSPSRAPRLLPSTGRFLWLCHQTSRSPLALQLTHLDAECVR